MGLSPVARDKRTPVSQITERKSLGNEMTKESHFEVERETGLDCLAGSLRSMSLSPVARDKRTTVSQITERKSLGNEMTKKSHFEVERETGLKPATFALARRRSIN
jgi:predicted NodU family carbamoyl transferase